MSIRETPDGIIIDNDESDGVVELFVGPLSNAQNLPGPMPQVVIDSSNRKVYVFDGIIFWHDDNPAQSFYRRSATGGAPLPVNSPVGGPRFEAIVQDGDGTNNVRIAEIYSRLRGDSTMGGARGSLHFAVRQESGDVRDVLVLTEDGRITDGNGKRVGVSRKKFRDLERRVAALEG